MEITFQFAISINHLTTTQVYIYSELSVVMYFSHLIVSIMPAYRSCLVQSSRSKVRGSLNSLGLIQRTKKG